jgi:hypothetical protein
MSAVPTTSPLRPVHSDYDDGSDEQENGDITDDNSDFEEEDGLTQDGRNDEDDANEGNLTESSESEEEVESPAPVNKTGGRNPQKAPSIANKTPASRVRSGRVIKSGTAASGTPLKCPVKNCDKTFTGKNPRQCLWQPLSSATASLRPRTGATTPRKPSSLPVCRTSVLALARPTSATLKRSRARFRSWRLPGRRNTPETVRSSLINVEEQYFF